MNNIALVTVLLALLFCCLLVQGWDTKYCDETLCYPGTVHTACNNTGKLGKSCGKGSKVIAISPELKNLILERHNFYRNEVARGGLKRFPKAVRMGYMLWDDELAYVASLHSLKCEFKHDGCRYTNAFLISGQNIAIRRKSDDITAFDAKSSIQSSIDSWFKEHANSNRNQIMKFKEIKDTGHFTQIVADMSIRIGCGVVVFPSEKYKTNAMLVCNYARNNILQHPVYKSGMFAGSGCLKGTDNKFKALCKPDEPIDANEI